MRCERCGGPIGNRIIRLNGVTICENCARELRVDETLRTGTLLNQTFPILGELTNAIMSSGSDLEFSNTKIVCPRCKTTLRDVETTGTLGCIDCYNTFGSIIEKELLKRMGSSEYKGRKPGEHAEHKFFFEENKEEEKSAPDKAPVNEEKKPETKGDLSLEKIAKADLGMIPTEILEDAMMKAAQKEDYMLAARLRDEINSRKGDK